MSSYLNSSFGFNFGLVIGTLIFEVRIITVISTTVIIDNFIYIIIKETTCSINRKAILLKGF